MENANASASEGSFTLNFNEDLELQSYYFESDKGT